MDSLVTLVESTIYALKSAKISAFDDLSPPILASMMYIIPQNDGNI
jgi:hypothetical protein